ncbi:MAG TPA: aldehyde-activating protein [Fibrobacteres bacterium]|nr:aldehyde-activating protein [Fibrobacterota bacterium]
MKLTVGVLSEASKLRILSGKVKGHTTMADSGRKITREFCPECGSPLFTRSEKFPDKVSIKAGSLDEPGVVMPSIQTWTERAVLWAYLDNSLKGYLQGRPL